MQKTVRMNVLKLSAITFITALSAGCASDVSVKDAAKPSSPEPIVKPAATSSMPLKLATWNVEHLAYPIDLGCKARTPSEISAMKAYATSLNADIIALQEVASKEALQQVFPESDWQLIISQRADSPQYTCRKTKATSTQQKVAFAVKKTLPLLKSNEVEQLSLARPGLRYGLAITVDSPKGPMDILNVHMKSGCFVDDYQKSESPACGIYAKQVPILNDWIAERESQGRAYVILGDFNHRISAPYNRLTRNLLNNNRSTRITTANTLGCNPLYPAPIDHIIVGGMYSKNISRSAQVHPYKNSQAEGMLSDHCAVSVSLFDNTHAVSNAVLWQTKSKEYKLLSQNTYKEAQAAVKRIPKTDSNWVAVMDVDETVLDNSAYQKQMESINMGFTNKTWQAWVKNEQATLVPGAKSFIESVYQQGGKVALITNRNKQLDANTWNNLKALGIPMTTENTCLMGRSQRDKDVVDNQKYINDKDLRREQITKGQANCFNTQPIVNNHWQAPYSIKFQVGDNIQDFSGVTQQQADLEALLPELGNSLFLLPNPMYGSWSH